MDIISASIYIILFILLMVFVFSMGLLTPIIGKKDVISVLTIGFVVGLVGGAFFVTPVYQELPNVVEAVYETFTNDTASINIEVSPYVNLNELTKNLNKTDGVISIVNKGIVVKTDSFSTSRKKIIEEKIPIVDENFENFSVNESGLISINFTENYNPTTALKTLSDWLMYTGGINTRYSLVNIEITAEPSKADDVVEYLHSNDIVVKSVNGSVEDAINNTKNSMVDNNIVILLSGVFGVILALISIFFDKIRDGIKKFIKKIKER
ncbi:hypothetical protein KQY27_04925 [Methanobrevibacter sp. TMH8]|uniref:hypothetical protein n=1 Tax=Methanobrevibacter sp. TMH8 TaxID=2848611 RepID=UPI001CCFE5A5|nr:hypothetical protein [Methanobrevibacter sp. TMH8]MBZ9570886.1 hypothetical protein [Methanobrevibacter sp. TMH8]